MRRLRLRASFVLAAYLAAALALPVLHQRHHALHGDDHVHGPLGTIYLPGDPAGAADDEAYHHAAFDADLAALELSDVAHAGTAEVDCALAAYTLAACEESSAGAGHAPSFGDQLVAHRHSRPRPFDPAHGRGALEHFGASLVGVAPFVLPPPALPATRIPVEPAPRSFACAPRLTHASRGPPVG